MKLGYLAKSHNLQILSCGMFTDNLDLKTSKKLFKSCIEIKDVMLDPDLGLTVFEFGSLLVYKDESVGPSLTRVFTSVIANPKLQPAYCLKASKAVGLGSKKLPQDSVVTTIYSLTNLLFVSNEGLQLPSKNARRLLKGAATTNSTFNDAGSGREMFASPISSRRTSITSFSQAFSKMQTQANLMKMIIVKFVKMLLLVLLKFVKLAMMKLFQHWHAPFYHRRLTR